MEAIEVERIIRDAFSRTPRPTGMLTNTYDDEGAHEYFTGRDWDGHNPHQIRLQQAALSFFTPQAFRYYLPAFMLAELKDHEAADVVGEYVVYKFGPPEDYWRPFHQARLELLAQEEKHAVLTFIRYMQEKYGGFELYLNHAELELSDNPARDADVKKMNR